MKIRNDSDMAGWPPDLGRLAGPRLLVIGDIILDRYVWAEVSRISPEAPTPVAHETGVTDAGGGAFNVARNALAAGGRVDLIGVVGDDAEGRRVRELMAELGVESSGLIVDPGRPTTVKTRIVSGGHQLLRLDREVARDVAPELEWRLIQAAGRAMKRAQAVILSDYRKGALTAGVAREVTKMARALGRPVIVDPKRLDFTYYSGADYLTPNLKEAAEASRASLSGREEIEREGRRLIRKFQGRGIVITRGHEGLTYVPRSGAATHIPAQAREVFDVTGAGDTFIAHFALAIAAGFGAADAARIGNAAAGVAVSKPGAVTVSPQELAAAAGLGDGAPSEGLLKIRSTEDLRLTLQRLRSEGRRIVLARGDFEIIGPEMIRALRALMAAGDSLVLAVSAGEEKTAETRDERAAILAGLPMVDYVTMDEGERPGALVEKLRPDVLAVASRREMGGATLPEDVEVIEAPGLGTRSRRKR